MQTCIDQRGDPSGVGHGQFVVALIHDAQPLARMASENTWPTLTGLIVSVSPQSRIKATFNCGSPVETNRSALPLVYGVPGLVWLGFSRSAGEVFRQSPERQPREDISPYSHRPGL